MRTLLLGVVMVVVGGLSLPVTAYFLDTTAAGENLILPVAALASVGTGAGLGVPALDPDHPVRRRALVGAGLGLLGLAVGLVAFFLLLNGLDGA